MRPRPIPANQVADPAAGDRVVAVFSDIEMGAGGLYDDFPHSDFLAGLIRGYTEPPFEGVPVDLVFNGDTFDLLKTSWEGAYPHVIGVDVAVGKMTRVADAHPEFFWALKCFLESGPGRRVHFVVGNHDAELVFPEVQALIRLRVGAGPVEFPGFELEIGDMYMEHGQQRDAMFRVTPPGLIELNGERFLDVSWASIAILDVAMTLRPVLYHHDRLKPRGEAFRLLPEVRHHLLTAFRNYFAQDFWGGWLGGSDPVKRVSWDMLRELVRRLTSADTEISVSHHFLTRIRGSDTHRLIVFGHEHEAGLWTVGDRKVIRTGCFRNEYMLADEGAVQRPIPKTWAEAILRNDRVRTSRLIEVQGPPAPDGYVPESIFGVLDRVPPVA